jgi:hypothetical protein
MEIRSTWRGSLRRASVARAAGHGELLDAERDESS